MAGEGTQRKRPAPGRRGRPPRIDQQQIIAAAKTLAPGQLTMQAVADALGVDRSALNYYVGDRDGLVQLLVADLFDSELATVELPGTDWQDILRVYGHAIRDGVVRIGVVGTHFTLRGLGGSASLELAERITQTLLTAGFTVAQATDILTLVAALAFSDARDTLAMTEHREHAQLPEVADALARRPAEQYPAMRRVLAEIDHYARDFDFELDVVILGLERLLPPGRR